MRLWHKDLIEVLPRQQLLGQWRECCAIMANLAKKGTPGHLLVNKITDYPPAHFYWYAVEVVTEMQMRGYHPVPDNFCDNYASFTGEEHWPDLVETKDLFPGWHNERYLVQCIHNLEEKYDCGGMSAEEWNKIDDFYWGYWG